MSFIKYLNRLRRMDSLISRMATGTPDEFAEKMGIRRSTLFQSLNEMREIGVDIKYSNIRQTYYYADGRRIRIRLEIPESIMVNSKRSH
jgi:predicted DNA-binding transcriptional regulator YafY